MFVLFLVIAGCLENKLSGNYLDYRGTCCVICEFLGIKGTKGINGEVLLCTRNI